MSIDDLQPTPQTPDIRRSPSRPEMPGIVPPKHDKLPGEDKPEINDEDDVVIIPPPAIGPEIRRDRLPGVDHDDDDKDDGPPKPTIN